jgi:hypothetical protein
MSQMGHSRRFGRPRSLPVLPDQQTFSGSCGMSQTCQRGSDQPVANPVPTYASWRNENPPPSSIARSEKLAVSKAIVVMAA